MESPSMDALLQAVTTELKRTKQNPSRGAAHVSHHDPQPLLQPTSYTPEHLLQQLEEMHCGRSSIVLTRINAKWSTVEVALGAVESVEFNNVRQRLNVASRHVQSEGK